jgi:hypothetical protein
MLQENSTLPPSARLSIKSIYERIRDKEGFRGSYGSVKDYARPIEPDKGCIWEYAYDLLTTAGSFAWRASPLESHASLNR